MRSKLGISKHEGLINDLLDIMHSIVEHRYIKMIEGAFIRFVFTKIFNK